MLQSRSIFCLMFHQLSLHTDSDTYRLFSNKSIWQIEEDSIPSKRKKKIWIRSIGMELVGVQSWALKIWRFSPILRFPLDLFEIWAIPFKSIVSWTKWKKKYQNPSSIDRENACLPWALEFRPNFGSVPLKRSSLGAAQRPRNGHRIPRGGPCPILKKCTWNAPDHLFYMGARYNKKYCTRCRAQSPFAIIWWQISQWERLFFPNLY